MVIVSEWVGWCGREWVSAWVNVGGWVCGWASLSPFPFLSFFYPSLFFSSLILLCFLPFFFCFCLPFFPYTCTVNEYCSDGNTRVSRSVRSHARTNTSLHFVFHNFDTHFTFHTPAASGSHCLLLNVSSPRFVFSELPLDNPGCFQECCYGYSEVVNYISVLWLYFYIFMALFLYFYDFQGYFLHFQRYFYTFMAF